MNRKEIVKFRVTKLEKLAIENRAKNSGISTSAYCRAVAFNAEIKSKFTKEELKAFNTLHQYYRNFNDISNLFKKKDPNFAKECKLLARQIKGHLDGLK